MAKETEFKKKQNIFYLCQMEHKNMIKKKENKNIKKFLFGAKREQGEKTFTINVGFKIKKM